ncbi:MAG: hypothetical protein ACRC4M_05775 [Mycoplasma sp.]
MNNKNHLLNFLEKKKVELSIPADGPIIVEKLNSLITFLKNPTDKNIPEWLEMEYDEFLERVKQRSTDIFSLFEEEIKELKNYNIESSFIELDPETKKYFYFGAIQNEEEIKFCDFAIKIVSEINSIKKYSFSKSTKSIYINWNQIRISDHFRQEDSKTKFLFDFVSIEPEEIHDNLISNLNKLSYKKTPFFNF